MVLDLISKLLSNISIKRKFNIVYVSFTVLLLFMAAFLLAHLKDILYEQTMQHLDSEVLQLQQNEHTTLKDYKNIIDRIESDKFINKYISTQYDNAYNAYSDYMSYFYPLTSKIVSPNLDLKIYSNNKDIVFSSITNNTLDDLRKETWFDQSMFETFNTNLKWVNKNIFVSYAKNYNMVCYKVIPEYETTRKIKAVITLFTSNSDLNSLISSNTMNDKLILFYDEKMSVITSNIKKDSNMQDYELLLKRLQHKDYSGVINIGKASYLAINKHVEFTDLNINDWGILYLLPINQFTRKIGAALISSALVLLVCIAAIFIVMTIISNNIIKSINHLVQRMERIRQGELNSDYTAAGTDEMAQLENGFSDMVSRISVLIEDIVDANIKIKDTEIQKQKAELGMKESQLKLLQSQINPHYLFNTLEAIRMNLITEYKDNKTATIIRIFAESFRICIDRSIPFFTVKEEIDFIKMYFTIQKYRYKDRIQYTIEVDSELENCRIPKLIIQPLVENAIYHGIEMRQEGGSILVKIQKNADTMKILISDNGMGMSNEELSALKSSIYDAGKQSEDSHRMIALRNIHNRINILYGDEYGLSISSIKNIGTIVVLNLPIQSFPPEDAMSLSE